MELIAAGAGFRPGKNALFYAIYRAKILIIRKLVVYLCQETKPERPRIFESFEY